MWARSLLSCSASTSSFFARFFKGVTSTSSLMLVASLSNHGFCEVHFSATFRLLVAVHMFHFLMVLLFPWLAFPTLEALSPRNVPFSMYNTTYLGTYPHRSCSQPFYFSSLSRHTCFPVSVPLLFYSPLLVPPSSLLRFLRSSMIFGVIRHLPSLLVLGFSPSSYKALSPSSEAVHRFICRKEKGQHKLDERAHDTVSLPSDDPHVAPAHRSV